MASFLCFSLTFLTFVCLFRIGCGVVTKPEVLSIFSDDDNPPPSPKHGGVNVRSLEKTRVKLVGNNLARATSIRFTPNTDSCGNVQSTKKFNVSDYDEPTKTIVVEDVLISLSEADGKPMYLCLHWNSNKNDTEGEWGHQGSHSWLSLEVLEPEGGSLLPLWLQVSIISVLLVLSGLFSGLNLGLMSLDQTELSIIQKVGSPTEKKYAKRISPLRKKGNFLLCTLLLGNVMVNSTFTILFDDMTNGLIAIISSTFGIVVFGEIIPQAICSRHGLAVGAKTFWLTKFFMVVTFPLSFPISLLLDKILGEEIGQVFNKEKLQELIRMTADQKVLHDNEANIISGALQLTKKTVVDVMTNIEDVYMLDINTDLNFENLAEIMRHGYTRIPVYDGDITQIVNLLNIKDLALIDPDDETQLSTVCKFYDHQPIFVEPDATLNDMLQLFLKGNSHMAIVHKLNNTSDDRDPYYENTGVVTLEDVIEEILQSEIIDETDRMTDNRQKKPLTQQKDYTLLSSDQNKSKLPRQLEFVAFQFLASNVEAFSSNNLNRDVLKNLMKKNIVVNLTPTVPVSPKNFIFQKGTLSDKFVLILQGTVEVTIGSENMVFESGPFSTFGSECINSMKRNSTPDLKSRDYVPDFSVRAITPVQYLCIQRSHYMAAIRTTKMLRSHVFSGDDSKVNDHFDMEYAKLAHSEKNVNTSNKGIDVHSAPGRKLTNSLRSQRSLWKGSTSSLSKIITKSNNHDPQLETRMRRSGSDAKYTAVLDSDDHMGMKGNDSDAASNASGDNADWRRDSITDKTMLVAPASGSKKNFKTQTSQPFTPHLDQNPDDLVVVDIPSTMTSEPQDTQPAVIKSSAIEDKGPCLRVGNGNGASANKDIPPPYPGSPDAPDGTKAFGSMTMMPMEQLEKIPLVDVISGGQSASGDSSEKVFFKSVDDFSDCERDSNVSKQKDSADRNSDNITSVTENNTHL